MRSCPHCLFYYLYLSLPTCISFFPFSLPLSSPLFLQRIETDESAKRPEVVQLSEDEIEKANRRLREFVTKNSNKPLPKGQLNRTLQLTGYYNWLL